MIWEKSYININEIQKQVIAPLIISASRATDIPAFFAEEFMRCINRGYVVKVNPFNQKKEIVSFDKIKLIVFWTKNPRPLIPYLKQLDKKRINYYFQFTLNDYENLDLEPHLPNLDHRIKTFQKLADYIGKEKMIWRFDPVLFTADKKTEEIIYRIENIARLIQDHTEQLVFSFADLSYRKVLNKLKKINRQFHIPSDQEKIQFAEKLINKLIKYNLKITTCAQKIELAHLGIEHNKCIDDALILRLFPRDETLKNFILPTIGTRKLKDRGQRKYCGCIYSKDIGLYNTCSYFCRYCYATSSKAVVEKNQLKIFKADISDV